MSDKPLPWFRAYPESAFDPKFEIISVQTGLHPLIVFGAWWKILCLAANSPVRGSLYVTAMKRYSNGDVTVMLRMSNDECNTLIQAFTEMDMLDTDDTGAYRVKNWATRQFVSDTSAERVKKHREKPKTTECNGDVTLHDRYGNGDVTPPDTDTDTDTEKSRRGVAALLDDEISSVYNTVAGGAGLPSSEREDILVSLRALSVGRTRDELVEYLRPFYKAFREGPAKNKTRSYWLTDWAVRGEIPGTVQRGS